VFGNPGRYEELTKGPSFWILGKSQGDDVTKGDGKDAFSVVNSGPGASETLRLKAHDPGILQMGENRKVGRGSLKRGAQQRNKDPKRRKMLTDIISGPTPIGRQMNLY